MPSRADERAARVVFLDRETLSPETRLREPGFPHELVVYERTAPEQAAERIAGAEIVITNKVPLRGDVLRAADRLRLIAVAATGTEVVDVAAAAERGDHSQQHPQLRRPHGAGAHLRPNPGAAPQRGPIISRWRPGAGRRPASSATSTTRSATSRARRWGDRRRQRSARPWPSLASLRHARPVLDLQGRGRDGSALHSVRGGVAHQRPHHPARAPHAVDPT